VLLDPRNGPDWDLPPFTGQLQPYVIASSPRTGSTLLARLLWDTGLVGAPKEYLNPMQLRDWGLRLGSPPTSWALSLLRGHAVGLAGRPPLCPAPVGHLRAVMKRRTGPAGHFGIKLHFHHYEQHCRGGMAPLLGAEPKWIHITRQDRLAQAISWDRAMQSGQWAAHQRGPRLPQRYNRRRIQIALDRIEAQEAGWRSTLADRPVLHLEYEGLIQEKLGTLRQCLAWLGVEAQAVALPADGLRKQSDGVSAEWKQRFEAGD
jgi:LPS sulfotransferase NodH